MKGKKGDTKKKKANKQPGLRHITASVLSNKIVQNTDVIKLEVEGDTEVDIEQSWLGLILFMIGVLYQEYTGKFLKGLADNGVLSDVINVSTQLVDYTKLSNIEYKVYRIVDSPYYLEIRALTGNEDKYVQAIKGLFRMASIDLKKVQLEVCQNTSKTGVKTSDKIEDKTEESLGTQESHIESLGNLINTGRLDIDIEALTINNSTMNTHSTVQALTLFAVWANVEYEGKFIESAIKESLLTVGVKGISKLEDYSSSAFSKVRLGDNFMYISNDNISIVSYMGAVATRLKLNLDEILITYKQGGNEKNV